MVEGRERQSCPACPFVLYANPASASAAVVVREKVEVLLVRRAIEPFKGSWALPAGYQEMDEDPAAAAVREVREETGLSVSVERLMELIYVPDDPRKPANVAVFECRPTGGVLRAGSDALEVGWFHLERLPEFMGFDNNRGILERLRSGD